jgi:acid phosphatase (class A)
VGYVLATLMPDKAQVILARADDYAYSREICGDHFASDTEASHVLGTAVAIQMLDNPKVAPMVSAARAELRAAHLTGAN